MTRHLRFLAREAADDIAWRVLCAVLGVIAPRPVRHLAFLAGLALASGDPARHFLLEHLPEHLDGEDRGAQLAAGRRARQLARVAEDARDRALYDVGRVVLDMRGRGATDGDVVDAVLSMVELRMAAGMADPVAALAGGDASS